MVTFSVRRSTCLPPVATADSTDEPELVAGRRSPLGREALGRIAMRLTAGCTKKEVATLIEAERDEIEHLQLPRREKPVSTNWVNARLRDLRAEPPSDS